ncbi:MAG TPA: hypothetical protein V6C69_11250 [Trichormus sp.]|jgi:hypothetical protein
MPARQLTHPIGKPAVEQAAQPTQQDSGRRDEATERLNETAKEPKKRLNIIPRWY